MSEDLISRKALLKQFILSDSGRRIPEYDIDNFPITLSIKDVKDIIRKAPTVFDMEKVIEELEDYLFEKYCIEGDEKIDEIIEKGGIE